MAIDVVNAANQSTLKAITFAQDQFLKAYKTVASKVPAAATPSWVQPGRDRSREALEKAFEFQSQLLEAAQVVRDGSARRRRRRGGRHRDDHQQDDHHQEVGSMHGRRGALEGPFAASRRAHSGPAAVQPALATRAGPPCRPVRHLHEPVGARAPRAVDPVLRSLAKSLGIEPNELILYAAGLPVDQNDISTEDAIRRDERLTAAQRTALLSVLNSYLEDNGVIAAVPPKSRLRSEDHAAIHRPRRLVPLLRDAHAPMHVAGCRIYDPSTAPGGKVTFKGILDTSSSGCTWPGCSASGWCRCRSTSTTRTGSRTPDFDLEFHVRHIALPKPGDWRQLCIQVARLHSRALDLNRPLWEMYVIEGLDNVEGVPPGSFALLQKIHHAADRRGVRHGDDQRDPRPRARRRAAAEPSTQWRPERRSRAPWTLLGRAGVNNARRPVHVGRVLARDRCPRVGRLARRCNAATIAATRHAAHPLERHRLRRTGCSTASASTSPTSGRSRAPCRGDDQRRRARRSSAARCARYLRAKGELPDEPLVAMAPISVRDADRRAPPATRCRR